MNTYPDNTEDLSCLLELPVESSDERCKKFLNSSTSDNLPKTSKSEASSSPKSEVLEWVLAYIRFVFRQKPNEQEKPCDEQKPKQGSEKIKILGNVTINPNPRSEDDGYGTRSPCESSSVDKCDRVKRKRRKRRHTVNMHMNINVQDKENKEPTEKKINSKCQKAAQDSNESTRRRSPRLLSHPPGYFQTKPLMVIYLEPLSNYKEPVKKRKNNSCIPDKKWVDSLPPLRYSLPIVKRRKLYDPNIENDISV